MPRGKIATLTEAECADVLNAMNQILFVGLDVEQEDPQEIFESLNSTGLDLTNVDLLRNFLLMSLDSKTQMKLYDDYWFKIEHDVNPSNMVRFFRRSLTTGTFPTTVRPTPCPALPKP